MTSLFTSPDPDLEDQRVISEIHDTRASLADYLRAPKRWNGLLRRTSTARAIQGSNTIEGYTVSDEDAVAAVDDEPPLSANQATWLEILAYRRVLTYVLNVATEPGFVIDAAVLRSMHFMLLDHDLSKTPGRYRTKEIFVRDDKRGINVYAGPDGDLVPELMRLLSKSLSTPTADDPLVRGAMAHLNLVMIHPFRDGNGRMARALQTMVLAQDQVVEPTFSSIEEWLGNNTQDYYDVLAATGHDAWNPDNDATLWVKFNLRAHHMQAQTMRRRFDEAEIQWRKIDELVAAHRLNDRIGAALFDALIGLRVTRPSYVKLTELDERTATRDLVNAADIGLLEARGERRGRHYVAGEPLRQIQAELRAERKPLTDPYPTLIGEIRRALP
ncbi:Fic family protein [Nocardioides sp. LMS-CY]|uniref:Fic family protein n=1 Tax=Nocardioides sp. (strain LMS-CY) TaxID=2840457 RepID=UPI001C001A0D|nr:Fic family protein [Nocardioides sp. LMS-CY]QWF22606.1 Fic family protein [Nocardioides sp. LMS-CY]